MEQFNIKTKASGKGSGVARWASKKSYRITKPRYEEFAFLLDRLCNQLADFPGYLRNHPIAEYNIALIGDAKTDRGKDEFLAEHKGHLASFMFKLLRR